jgi:Mycothiol maleylpyruvate isomerase N-terminal domain
MSDQETVANMERVWQAIIALGSTFTEQEWETPTDCPGWTVFDTPGGLNPTMAGLQAMIP